MNNYNPPPPPPPQGVDYIGLDAKRERLLFFASSVETIKNLKLPLAALGSVGNLTISTDLADSHLYVFNRAVLSLLRERNNLASLKLDFMPVLVREQLRLQLQQQQGAAAAAAAGAAAGTPPPLSRSPSLLGPGMQGSPSNDGSSADFGSAAHRAGQPPLGIRVYTLQPETYLGRITSVPAYGSVNHDVAAADVALHLTGVKASKVDNVVPASTTLGNKTTVAAACIVGERCSLGDKASVKRSVIGHNCKVGVNVKVINSVLMDNVTVGEGCHIQNTVVCAGASVGAGATLKDCTVGPGYQVAGGAEYKSEELVKGAAAK